MAAPVANACFAEPAPWRLQIAGKGGGKAAEQRTANLNGKFQWRVPEIAPNVALPNQEDCTADVMLAAAIERPLEGRDSSWLMTYRRAIRVVILPGFGNTTLVNTCHRRPVYDGAELT